MSVAASSLRLAARRCQCAFARRQTPLQASLARSFTSSVSRREDPTPPEIEERNPLWIKKETIPPTAEELEQMALEETIEDIRHGDLEGTTARIINSHMTEAQRRRRPATVPYKKQKDGLLNMNEKDSMEDPEFEEDDITALAHADLEQHREYRKYARLMAWEMPLLTRMSIPYTGALSGLS
jgi:small subunit ribosomal protein S35